jgi:hypothetical protein
VHVVRDWVQMHDAVHAPAAIPVARDFGGLTPIGKLGEASALK